MDVGDGTFLHVDPPMGCDVYEGEGDSSSDDEAPTSSGTGQATQTHYVVQKILGKRIRDGKVQLFTKWAGFRTPEYAGQSF